MRRFLAGSLGWSLTWLAATTTAAEPWPAPWRPAGSPAAAATPAPSAGGVSLGRPQAVNVLPPAPSPEPRPLPAAIDPQVQQTGFRAEQPRPLPRWEQTPVATDFAPRPQPTPTVSRKVVVSGGSEFAADQAPLARAAVPASGTVVVSSAPVAQPVVSGGSVPAPVPGGTVINWMGPEAAYGEAPYVDGFSGGYAGGANWLYARAEYLLWGLRDQKYPVLVTTAPAGGTGILGDPGTVILFGGDSISTGAFHGGRFTLGFWCDPEQCWGIEANYFRLGEQSVRFNADSGTFPLLTRPFFDVNNGVESVELTAAPGLATGAVSIVAPSSLQGAELNLRCNWCRTCVGNLDFLIGGRWLSLDESLTITEDVTVNPNVDPALLPPGVLPGDRALVVDEFITKNQFYGIQFALDWERRLAPRWVLNVRPKLGVGVTQQTININGYQVVTGVDGTQEFFVGGLLALPSNIGRVSRTRFAVTTELNVNLGYEVTDSLTLFAGYSILYWSNVVRPADQIDRQLNINQIPNFSRSPNPGAVRPLNPVRETGVFAHGLNLGLEYRY
ncbi:MAG: BBP7 family outer membrane beta-barrel protein [Planctomycetia bacterium]|nr:BBP7 family outer membrane beta-barrel protein [Planctomycetia bacterium]